MSRRFLVLLAFFQSFPLAILQAQPVAIPDPVLESALRAALSKPSGDITQADLASLTQFTAAGSEGNRITNLTGLEFASNLTFLDLGNNNISNLAPLGSLPELTSLNLYGNTALTSVSALATTPKLDYLGLDDTSVTDFSPLSLHPTLATIAANYTGVNNLAPFATMPNLDTLDLAGNGISDLSQLAASPTLKIFYLAYNPISDITPLGAMPQITYLYLNDTDVSNLSPLAGHPNLEYLILARCPVSDLSPLATASNLRTLDVRETQVTSLASLNGIPIHTFHIGHLPVAVLAESVNFLSLRYLSANNLDPQSAAIDLSLLVALASLEHLGLEGNPVPDLSPVASLPNLQNLYLTGCGISDLSDLAGHPNLRYLGLGSNTIQDLTPLASIPNLYYLFVAKNHLHDLTPLKDYVGLGHCYVTQNFLDLNPGSDDLASIANLQANGTNVRFEPQRDGVLPGFPPNPLSVTGQSALVDVHGTPSWTAEEDSDWIHLTNGPSGTGDGSFNLNWTTNTSVLRRYAMIALGDEDYLLWQDSACNMNVAPFRDLMAEAVEAPGIWYQSERYGWFYREDATYPWIHHLNIGWLFAYLNPTETDWLYCPTVGGYLSLTECDFRHGYTFIYFIPDSSTVPEGWLGTTTDYWPWAYHLGVDDWRKMDDYVP